MNEAVKKPDAAAPVPTKEIVIELSHPVQAHGETIKKITFREPTGRDMTQISDWPVHANTLPNPAAMAQVMSLLAMVPPSTISSLAGQDFTDCAFALRGFFLPSAQVMQY